MFKNIKKNKPYVVYCHPMTIRIFLLQGKLNYRKIKRISTTPFLHTSKRVKHHHAHQTSSLRCSSLLSSSYLSTICVSRATCATITRVSRAGCSIKGGAGVRQTTGARLPITHVSVGISNNTNRIILQLICVCHAHYSPCFDSVPLLTNPRNHHGPSSTFLCCPHKS